ncbi:HlyD family efflux transporter periplasmic adaptor subunit [Rhodovastum atsumiense]|uniref:HlyD family efflux transporter periplasmic adaptor subunit n=1 Tax=Rhodovastum atsumiense TaxID=504468 RepID=A0A5M6IY36_9PROT|nr:HlyD family efflux transporter periplasmic adaptor subunit [Rhodovastum atsumiense]KAA5613260.1 HlyD family efflux transporter periplasmic adaptor subunit [Rhodovastum atsumiense]CAH2600578.1 HlyD family efflux transporter periplasmic adaptor subunit [Rhodovastum atsumiense]
MAVPRTLFRQEAIEFQQHHRQWGEIALLQPLSMRITVWFVTVVVAAIVVFLSQAPYTRKETVSGYLMPTAGTARIYAQQPGVISTVFVEEGQDVVDGQPLLSITTPQVSTDGADVNGEILDALLQQRDRLNTRIKAEANRTAAEARRLRTLILGLTDSVTHLEAQIELQHERITLAQALVDPAVKLYEKGYISGLDLNKRKEAVLEHKISLDSLSQQLAERRNQLTEQQSALEQLPVTAADRTHAMNVELSSLEQRIFEVNGKRAYIIRAPISGRVSAVQATVGEQADPRRQQMSIVPAGGTMQAELLVPTRAMGFVRLGQRVRILYEAFPYQNFGTYGGHIVRVSRTVLTGTDMTGPLTPTEPVYRVSAALDRPDVEAHGQRRSLQPDMLLRADIILDRRSLMEWLVSSLLGTSLRGMQP